MDSFILNRTEAEYKEVIDMCQDLFIMKTHDYGTAWRILRPSSITDQIFIKAQRIRTLEETGINKVGENTTSEYIGIINYCIMGMLQLELDSSIPLEINPNDVTTFYDQKVKETYELMLAKNHDYGEAWRDMRISSFTDLILMKLLRVKQIEDNSGKTIISEGIKANYQDIVNYSVFAMIKVLSK